MKFNIYIAFIFGQMVLRCYGTKFIDALTPSKHHSENYFRSLLEQEQKEIVELQKNLTSLISDFRNLQDIFHARQRTLKTLQQIVVNRTTSIVHEDIIKRLQEGLNDCQKAIPSLKKDAEKSSWMSQRVIDEEHKEVVFSVGFKVNQTRHQYHNILMFDNVFINEGNRYSSDTGMFVAPFIGTYRFTLTLVTHNANEQINFFVNGIKRQSVFTFVQGDKSTGEITVLYNLDIEDKVWVGYANEAYSASVIDSKGTILTGHLLK